MFEVEIKVPADVDIVRERLERINAEQADEIDAEQAGEIDAEQADEIDAERIDARRQRDVYYDAPHREFAETDEALRLRHETPLEARIDSEAIGGTTTLLTYKGPLVEDASKTRSEHETVLEDATAAEGILAGLGFDPAATVRKRREFWSVNGFTVTLDAVDGVGEYVEIEREVDSADAIDATRKEAIAVLDRLELDANEQVRTSYLGLLLESEAGTGDSERLDSN